MVKSIEEHKSEQIARRAFKHIKAAGLIGKMVSPEVLNKIGTSISHASGIMIPKEIRTVLRSSLFDLLGERLGEKKCMEACRRVAFGREELKEGRLLNIAGFKEGVEKIRIKDIRMGADPVMSMEVLSGPLSGRLATKRYNHGFVRWFGWKGGLKGRKPREYHPLEMYGMEANVFIVKKDGGLLADGFDVEPGQKRRNADLRLKRQKADCDQPCFFCPKGVDRCELATHEEPWTAEECEKGHAAYHRQGTCLQCAQKEYMDEQGVIKFQEKSED